MLRISEGWFQTLNNLQSMTCVRQYDQFCKVQNHQTVKDKLPNGINTHIYIYVKIHVVWHGLHP